MGSVTVASTGQIPAIAPLYRRACAAGLGAADVIPARLMPFAWQTRSRGTGITRARAL